MVYPLPAALCDSGRHSRRMESHHCGMDRNHLLRPGDALYLGTPRTPFSRHFNGTDGIHRQPHHSRHGARHRLVRSPFRKGFRQMERNRTYSDSGRESGFANHRTVSLSALNAVSSLSHRSAATTCLSPKSSTSGADSRFIEPETDRFALEKSGLMAYCHGHFTFHSER